MFDFTHRFKENRIGRMYFQVRIQDMCKGGGARFCRHRAAESRRRQKFGPQNGGSKWGGGPRSAPDFRSLNVFDTKTVDN